MHSDPFWKLFKVSNYSLKNSDNFADTFAVNLISFSVSAEEILVYKFYTVSKIVEKAQAGKNIFLP